MTRRARLYIARHGNTFDKGDVLLRVGRRTDLTLSASGREQAAALGRLFAGEGVSFAAILSAPLKRAAETAAAIQTEYNGAPPIIIEPFLTELDYGEDDGKPETEVAARLGAAALRDWDENAVPPPGWAVDAATLRQGWTALFQRMVDRHPGANALAVTSNGVARFALDAAQGGHAFPRKLRTGAYGVVDIDETGARIVAWDKRPQAAYSTVTDFARLRG